MIHRSAGTRLTGQEQVNSAESSLGATGSARSSVEVSISIRSVLLVAAVVAVAWALGSIGNILLLIFVSIFCVAVLLPVVGRMERRLHWSRGLCAAVLVLGTVVLMLLVLLVVVQAISGAVRGFSHDVPHVVDEVKRGDLGKFLNGGSGALDTLRKHAGDITNGVGKASGGLAHVGVSALGAVTLVISVIFLTLFGVAEEPRVREWTGSLMYRDKRKRYYELADQIIDSTSRYMIGNLAISVICGTVYGITAVILGVPYPLALALIAGILDLVPNVGATIAGIIIGIVALSVSVTAMIIFVIVIVVYQQVENYILQPTIIGKAANVSAFTVLVSVLAFGALFGFVGAIIAVPLAAGFQIIIAELTAPRRAAVAAADAEQQPPE